MQKQPRPLTCYIAALHRPPSDPHIAAVGARSAIVTFTIPDYGILFRARADGNLIDLHFKALFGLLGFIRNRLEGEKIAAVRVLSSNAEFVFGLSAESRYLRAGEKRRRLLRKFRRELTLSVEYVRSIDNQAMLSPADLPPLPKGARIALAPSSHHHKSFGSSPDFGLDT